MTGMVVIGVSVAELAAGLVHMRNGLAALSYWDESSNPFGSIQTCEAGTQRLSRCSRHYLPQY